MDKNVSTARGFMNVYPFDTITVMLSANVKNKYRVEANKIPPSQALKVRFQSWHIVRWGCFEDKCERPKPTYMLF